MQNTTPTTTAVEMSRSTKAKRASLIIDSTRSNENAVPAPQPSPLLDLAGIDLSSFGGDFNAGQITMPHSPPASPRIQRTTSSKSFLPTVKSRTASEQDQRAEPPQRRQTKDDEAYKPSSSSMSKIYHLRKNPGSTPELSLLGSAENVRRQSEDVSNSQAPEIRPSPRPLQQDDAVSTKRREKTFRNPLSRTKSIRRDSNSKSKPTDEQLYEQPPKTAPLRSDWQGSADRLLKANSKDKRGKSAERAIVSESDDNLPVEKQQVREKDRHAAFMAGSKNVMNKAKSGGGSLLNRLGKIKRAGSNHEKEVPDSEYVLRVLNLPLIEQTRITRISKDLSKCRDKTEYWMPSLPWRCIDYLNLNCESEGLYRVPGSGPQVKHWQRKFDTELDVDLLSETDLYDPNIIGSMLKSWLRERNPPIFPPEKQNQLAKEMKKDNPDYARAGEEAPQILRNALSELPPFNYYLLFAVTCHLSLLLSHKEKNKMDLNNLLICIAPCLKLESWLFNYLVGDWRRCWQGCFSEKRYLEMERAHEQGLAYEPSTSPEQPDRHTKLVDERLTSSRGGPKSRQGSNDSDAKTIASDVSSAAPRHEPLVSEFSLPALPDYSQYVNGGIPTPERKPATVIPEIRRPATAHADEPSEAALPAPKMPSHTRSQSDLPLTPVKPASPIDFPFKVRNE